MGQMWVLSCAILLNIGLSLGDDASCTWSTSSGTEYNFALLDGVSWSVYENLTSGKEVFYSISVCSALKESGCSGQSAVCRKLDNNFVNVGLFASPLNIVERDKELWLQLTGDVCTSPSAGQGQKHNTTINFKCGKTLGSPILIDSYDCNAFFEWHTAVACKDNSQKKEVPCYLYDNTYHRKYDLSPLTKTKGGHLVQSQSTSSDDFFINVCREITPDGASAACPTDHAGACRVSGSSGFDIGRPVDRLKQSSEGKLFLHYSNEHPGGNCIGPASTTITFICPASRGQSRPPTLLATGQEDCQFNIQWYTEYACPEHTLVSQNCTLSQSLHGINVDLTPLQQSINAEHRYEAIGSNSASTKTYKYVMNICADAGVPCPTDKDGVAVCQIDENDATFGRIMGRTKNSTLRYSDRELTLTYSNGQICRDGFARTTVINFHCNQSAENEGRGGPVFNNEEDGCLYIFDWGTKYACLDVELMCWIEQGDVRYDVSSLTRTEDGHESDWEASSQGQQESYFLNVCGDIIGKDGTPSSQCPDGASACARMQDGSMKSLGKFATSIAIGSHGELELHYTDGDVCHGDQKYETKITLHCVSDHVHNVPRFVSKEGCVYKFEWHTAAACHQGSHTGTNCRISDDDGSGYNIDLKNLIKSGDSPFYHVSTDQYDYYINVCHDIGSAHCTTSGDKAGKVGGCQVKKTTSGTGDSHIMGLYNENLVYYNGLINVHYTEGDIYRDNIPRQMHINFICNRTADVGEPEYYTESNHTYSFNWQTRYACPDTMMACAVVDENTHKEYDFSGLVRMPPSSMWNALDGGHKFYINICGALSTNLFCDAGAAACATQLNNAQEVAWISNLGTARQPPQIDANGQKLLVYEDGADCEQDHSKKYSTHIHLVCKREGEAQLEFTETLDDGCVFSFTLNTAEACDPEDTSTTDEHAASCTVRDPTSEHVYNLAPLKKKSGVYEVSAAQHTFKLNVCGAAPDCGRINEKPAAVCDGSEPLASVSSDLKLSASGQLTLTYTGKRDAAENVVNVIIKFQCNHSKPLGEPRYDGIHGHDHVFIWETSLACEPAEVDCEMTDRYGHLYNLGPLYKDQGNWHVTSPSGDDYYINVCGPINAVDGVACPAGNVGGCQVASNGPHSLGFLQSKPHFAGNGSLTVRYLGGEGCHTGTERESLRSTRIFLFCSPLEHEPVYVDETPECEYIFNWWTPAACPITRVYGAECKVKEPIYGHEFDLTHLTKSDGSNYEKQFGNYTYELNVCGALQGPSGDCAQDNMAACQTKPGTDYNMAAGQVNQTLVYYDGALQLTYLHGKDNCHGKYERSTVITFTCDHGKTDTSGLRYVTEESSCTYRFEWAIYLACPPREQSLCCISKDGKDYDLSELTLNDRNYQVEDPNSNKVYIINVCSNVISKQGVTCPPDSAACIIDYDATGNQPRYSKIGDMSKQVLAASNGSIVITSPTREPCSGSPGQYYSTILTLTCPRDGQSGQPHLMFVEGCSYHFRWDTHAACPVDHSTETATSTGNCEVQDPESGEMFDLKGWQNTDEYHVTDRQGNSLSFDICKATKKTECSGDGVGSCAKKNQGTAYSAGKVNDKPIFDNGMVYLNYSGGDTCTKGQARNTLIYFIPSSPGTGYGEPTFIANDDDCTFHVAFYTEMIASSKKAWSCSTTDGHGHVFDLSPLSRSHNNHLALLRGDAEPDSTYYISICAPLAPIENVLCPPMSAACVLKAGQPPLSLGRVGGPPTFDTYTKEAYLVYDHGSPCPGTPGTNYSTKVIFTCETGPDLGEPYFIEKSECQYIFNWGTNLLCHTSEPVQTTDCKFTDSQTGYTYDLSPLTRDEHSYHVGAFYLNVCGGVVESSYRDSGCLSPVCRVGEEHSVGFGSVTSQQFVMEGRDIKVSYTSSNTDDSLSCKLSSHIIFKCNQTGSGLGSPTLFMQSQCNVVFKWYTPLACPPVVEECAIAHDHGTIDLRPLSRPNDSWIVSDGNKNRYWLNLCRSVHKPVESDICHSNAAACRQLADGTVDMLGAVQTQRLYMDVDGETIIMEYSQGSNACSQRRRSISGSATTQVRLICGQTIGAPQIIPRKGDTDNCQFTFEWTTSVACKEKRAPVALTNGKIQDPETGAFFDYNSLVGTREMEIKDYVIRLDSESVALDGCAGAAICRKKDDNHYESIGDTGTAKFYMEGDVLEVVLTSQTPCSSESSKYSKCIIDIQCDEDADLESKPALIYKSQTCEYFFNWYTRSACLSEEVSAHGSPVDLSTGSSRSHSHAVGAVVGVVCAVIVIALLAIVFHKPERRIAFRNRLKSIWSRKGFGTSYSYAQLSSSDHETLLGGTSHNIPFHDDSDEDLIL